MDPSQDCKYCFKCINCKGLRFERRRIGVTNLVENRDQQQQSTASSITTSPSSKLVGPSPMMRSVSSRGRDTGPPHRPRSSSPSLGRGMRWMMRDTKRTTRSESPSPMRGTVSQKGKKAGTTRPPPDSSQVRSNESPRSRDNERAGRSPGTSSMQRSVSSSSR